MTKTALYARVSSDRQDVDLSISAQLKLPDYAEKNEHRVVREYVDEAEGERTTDRPQFQQMIGDAKRPTKPFSLILVWSIPGLPRIHRRDVLGDSP